jgi:integrase
VRGDGTIFRRKDSPSFWIQYCVRGKVYRELGGRTEKEARKRLRERIRQIQGDRFVGLEQERLTVAEVLDGYARDLSARKAKSIDSTLCHLAPVRAALGPMRALALRTSELQKYQERRLAAGKAAQTVDHELGALRAAFNLAKRQERIGRTPFVPMLRPDNRRTGFFEGAEFEAVASNLPVPIADVARFAYASGWRRSEVVALTWEQVDRPAREVRLPTSKNGRPRVIPLEGILWQIIERRWAARQYELPGGETALSPLVFHSRGRRVGDFRKAWAAACVKAGLGHFEEYVTKRGQRMKRYVGKIFHDLRRTAVRDMVRAGVNQSVAMSLSGHRTVSVFLRYDIASDKDKREALRAMETYRDGRAGKRNVAAFARAPERKS